MRVSARLVVFVGLSIVVTAGSCVAAVGFARRFLLHAGELEQALRRESAQRDRILSSVPAMVFMKDTSNRLVWVNGANLARATYMNRAFERIAGDPLSGGEVGGR